MTNAYVPIFQIGCDASALSRAKEYCAHACTKAISLRELFLRQRGATQTDGNACVLLMRIKTESELQSVLSALNTFDMSILPKISMTIETTVNASMCDKLIAYSHVRVIPMYKDDCVPRSSVVFCDAVNADRMRDMRKNGVRMVLTADRSHMQNVPDGMDVLVVTDLPTDFDTMVKTKKNGIHLLPLDDAPMFFDSYLAIPLAIVGTNRDLLARILASAGWQTTYQPVKDCYRTEYDFAVLQTVDISSARADRYALRAYLTQGYYVEMVLQGHTLQAELGNTDHLLLYGYDGNTGIFVGKTASDSGEPIRVDLLPQTVEQISNLRGTRICLRKIATTQIDCDTDTFAECLNVQPSIGGDVFYGREAAIRYANRFYKTFADGSDTLSVSSLRMFLQERVRLGFAMWYHALQNDFYLVPFEEHLRKLKKETDKVLAELHGKEVLLPEIPMYLTSERMRNLLHAEDATVSAFLDEHERAQSRRTYLQNRV